MRILSFTVILFTIVCSSAAQQLPTKKEIVEHFGFVQKSMIKNGERITYYMYKSGDAKPTRLIVYLQGSDPSPQFSYRVNGKEIQKLCWLHGEFKELSEEYLYVVIEKVGFEGLIDENSIPTPLAYQQKNSLEDRVFRADHVIKELCAKYDFEKVIVYGHSEGAPVAAKLGTLNNLITHLGFWAGNALPDFYDFILENRFEYHKGNISAEEAQKGIDATISSFVDDIANDTSRVSPNGYTNKRWWSFAEPPINNLLKIDIPIFVQVATDDKSAPIESTYLIPLEFARLGKENLTYKVCVGCDHGFQSLSDNGDTKENWKKVFKEFLDWAEVKG